MLAPVVIGLHDKKGRPGASLNSRIAATSTSTIVEILFQSTSPFGLDGAKISLLFRTSKRAVDILRKINNRQNQNKIMSKKKYNWLVRLIDRITRSEQPNNDYFEYYGHRVTLQSGTRDYVSVTISDMDYRNQTSFSFDYWTKELDLEGYNSYDERDVIIKAFNRIYNDRLESVSIGYDEPWEEERKFYEPMLDNDEYDQEDIKKEYERLMSREAA